MAKMIQIRHVPDAVHRTLRRRARQRGQTLSDYLRLRVEAWARQDSLEEALERLRGLPPAALVEPAAVTIRRERARR
ncbi:MAG TPA: hypothetical protein VN690_09305 [Terriglobales bacterium]|nr:hypothetical protein [Terriglobales bacterium]